MEDTLAKVEKRDDSPVNIAEGEQEILRDMTIMEM
jgi:hypothetical protein